jgi:hypothetical protein
MDGQIHREASGRVRRRHCCHALDIDIIGTYGGSAGSGGKLVILRPAPISRERESPIDCEVKNWLGPVQPDYSFIDTR